MAVHGYFDDSGDGNGTRITSIGGLVGLPEQWEKFDKRWKKAAKKLNGPFHATDCEALRGCCDGWAVSNRNELMDQLVTTILDCGVRCFGIVVPIQEYCAVFPNAKKLDPYFLAFRHMVANMAIIGEQSRVLGRNDEINVCHESGNANSRLGEIFQEFLDFKEWENTRYLQGMYVGRKNLAGLQGADLVARETFKFADNQGKDLGIRIPVKRLHGRITFFPWNRECLERLKSYGGPESLKGLIDCMTDNPPPMIMKRWPK
jgi:hypothetical protein